MKKTKILASLLLSILTFTACTAKNKEGPYTAEDFPLSIVLEKTEYTAGDTISFTLTITNRCGKTVRLYSNGEMPCVVMHEIGHSLGWLGHSINSSDVMYMSATSINALTIRDSSHLNQIQ